MKKNAFTLLEVILAIFILTVGVTGSFALIQSTLVSVSLNKSKLIAYYLAQEGVETTRNTRDSNFLAIHRRVGGVGWDDGITDVCPFPRISPCDFYGDVNFDGVVTQTDSNLIAEYSAALIEFNNEQIERADVNNDQDVNVLDTTAISNYISCSINTFTVCDAEGNFQREIVVSLHGGDPNILEILSRITWSERGRSHSAEVLGYIYNWYGQ